MTSASSGVGELAVQLGLTGSIGMGKSTISTHFRSMGFPVFDADATVHQLYAANGAAVGPIGALFPDAIVDGAVSRPVLGKKVTEDPSVLKALEAVVHPLVAAERRAFYEAANRQGHFLVVYDIPLLLENPTSQEVDYVVVATASAETQRRRVLERPGMTEGKFASLLAKQMPDADKRSKADFLIHTDFPSLAPARAQVASVVEALVSKHAGRWEAWKSRVAAVATAAAADAAAAAANAADAEAYAAASTTGAGAGSLADAFDLVVFDLDDTLVPVFHPIKPATEALFDFMAQQMPKTAISAKDQLRIAMGQVTKEHPLMAHDLTEVRREALRVLAAPHGEDGAVDAAMQVVPTPAFMHPPSSKNDAVAGVPGNTQQRGPASVRRCVAVPVVAERNRGRGDRCPHQRQRGRPRRVRHVGAVPVPVPGCRRRGHAQAVARAVYGHLSARWSASGTHPLRRRFLRQRRVGRAGCRHDRRAAAAGRCAGTRGRAGGLHCAQQSASGGGRAKGGRVSIHKAKSMIVNSLPTYLRKNK